MASGELLSAIAGPQVQVLSNQWRKDRALAQSLFPGAKLLEETCHSHYAHRTFARWTLQLIPHRATPSQAQESECRLIQSYGKRVWTGFSLPKMLHSG